MKKKEEVNHNTMTPDTGTNKPLTPMDKEFVILVIMMAVLIVMIVLPAYNLIQIHNTILINQHDIILKQNEILKQLDHLTAMTETFHNKGDNKTS